MLSVTKHKLFFINFLAVIFLLLPSPTAFYLDTPELTWEWGRQHSITLGGNTSSVIQA
jgi:hypothetical protein